MTKLAEIQEAILQLAPQEQQVLRHWLDETTLDLEEDSPALEGELLKAVQGSHSPLLKSDIEALANRAAHECRSA